MRGILSPLFPTTPWETQLFNPLKHEIFLHLIVFLPAKKNRPLLGFPNHHKALRFPHVNAEFSARRQSTAGIFCAEAPAHVSTQDARHRKAGALGFSRERVLAPEAGPRQLSPCRPILFSTPKYTFMG